MNRLVLFVLGALGAFALMALAPAEAAAQCTNSCPYANDGECDDGGPGALYSVCDYGTDCNDCGPRAPQAAAPAAQGGTLCTNTCRYASDGDCDDGGPGSDYSLCELGTDCNDCGPRDPAAAAAGNRYPEGPGCTNTCRFANDGDCDDGGPSSTYSLCELGTDCNDCGPRGPGAGAANTGAVPEGYICLNTCGYAADGDCDDGGPNSAYAFCRYGTDCTDCGPRPPMLGCTNTCRYANDGDCDDGGPGSAYSLCDLGTDCGDCGPR